MENIKVGDIVVIRGAKAEVLHLGCSAHNLEPVACLSYCGGIAIHPLKDISPFDAISCLDGAVTDDKLIIELNNGDIIKAHLHNIAPFRTRFSVYTGGCTSFTANIRAGMAAAISYDAGDIKSVKVIK